VFPLRFQFVKLLVKYVVNLLLMWNTVPVIEIIDLRVVLVNIITKPYSVKSVGSHLHSPNVFAMLNVNILWKFSARSIELIDETNKVGRREFRNPFVHELTRQLKFIFFICPIEIFSLSIELELAFVIPFSQEIWHKLWGSECLINHNGLVPVFWRSDVLPRRCFWIVSGVRVKIQVSWLNELVHEVNRLGLLCDERASSGEHVVSVLATVLFVIVVVDVSDDTGTLLLDQDVEGSIFDEESSEPFESSEGVGVAKAMDLETL
jgi:hypothetical protein